MKTHGTLGYKPHYSQYTRLDVIYETIMQYDMAKENAEFSRHLAGCIEDNLCDWDYRNALDKTVHSANG